MPAPYIIRHGQAHGLSVTKDGLVLLVMDGMCNTTEFMMGWNRPSVCLPLLTSLTSVYLAVKKKENSGRGGEVLSYSPRWDLPDGGKLILTCKHAPYFRGGLLFVEESETDYILKGQNGGIPFFLQTPEIKMLIGLVYHAALRHVHWPNPFGCVDFYGRPAWLDRD